MLVWVDLNINFVGIEFSLVPCNYPSSPVWNTFQQADAVTVTTHTTFQHADAVTSTTHSKNLGLSDAKRKTRSETRRYHGLYQHDDDDGERRRPEATTTTTTSSDNDDD